MQELLESLQGTEKYSYNNEAILCPIPLLQLNQREKKRLKIVIVNNKGINELPIPSISILYLTTASVNMNEVSMLKNGQIKTHTCTSMQTILNERLVSHIFCWQHFYSNSIKNKLYTTQTNSRTHQCLKELHKVRCWWSCLSLIILEKKYQQNFSCECNYRCIYWA